MSGGRPVADRLGRTAQAITVARRPSGLALRALTGAMGAWAPGRCSTVARLQSRRATPGRNTGRGSFRAAPAPAGTPAGGLSFRVAACCLRRPGPPSGGAGIVPQQGFDRTPAGICARAQAANGRGADQRRNANRSDKTGLPVARQAHIACPAAKGPVTGVQPATAPGHSRTAATSALAPLMKQ